MIKFVHDEIWFPDAEWVPDVEAGRRLYELRPQEFLRDHLSEAEMKEFGAKDDDYEGFTDYDVVQEMFFRHPKYHVDDNPRPFLKPILSRLVSLCFVRERQDKVTLHIIEETDEKRLLELFLNRASAKKPQLVGWNTREADLPLIIQRAMVHNLEAREFMKIPEKPWLGRDYFERFSGWHIDLMDLIAGPERRNRPSLSEACAAMNIVGPKTMTGKDVLDLWLKGTPEAMREIRLYCLLDCVRLYLIWLRLGRLAGFYPEDVARENAASALRQYDELANPQQLELPEADIGNHEDQAHAGTD